MANETRLAPRLMAAAGSGWADRLFHRSRSNTRRGSRRNIEAHYDLGNAFYRLWLDAGMTYSSGIYRSDTDTLETAQAEKYRSIIAALELESGHHLLEIGCGWGGLAEAAARAGAHVTGTTISAEQLTASRERMAAAGLAGRVSLHFEDYRDTRGTFDRIASVEMIEAVGANNWATYFRTLADRLRPGGVSVIQAITIRPDLYDSYRRNPDFIQRYIFPGGMLPTVPKMQEHCRAAGLAFETVETFGASYARTLREWRRRFEAAWPRIAAIGFDERFRRMWEYYLAYCTVGFECRTIDVGLYRLRKPAQG
jgi:cyclopropane-fatty-acyl-phospholipid synthase